MKKYISIFLMLLCPVIGWTQDTDDELPPGLLEERPRGPKKDRAASFEAVNFIQQNGNFVKANQLGVKSNVEFGRVHNLELAVIVANRFQRAQRDLEDKNRNQVEAMAELILLADCTWFPEAKKLQPKLVDVKQHESYGKALELSRKLKEIYLADKLDE